MVSGEITEKVLRRNKGTFNHFLKCRVCGIIYKDNSPTCTRNFCTPKCKEEARLYVVQKFLLSRKIFNQVQKEAWEYGIHAEEVVRRLVVAHYEDPKYEVLRRCEKMEKRMDQYQKDLQSIAAKAVIAESRTRPATLVHKPTPIEISNPVKESDVIEDKSDEDEPHIAEDVESYKDSGEEFQIEDTPEEELKDNEVE